MLENEKDVNNSAESSTEETTETTDVNNTTESSTETTGETTESQEAQGKEASNLNPELVDDLGVPWKNRAKEHERKLHETLESLPGMIEKKLQEFKSPKEEKDPTIEQLEQFAIEHPEHRPYAEARKAELMMKQFDARLEARLNADKKVKQADSDRASAQGYVVQNYPEAFAKDKSGKIVGWDENNPLTKLIGQVYETYGGGALKDNPHGLAAAADIAYGLYQKDKSKVVTKVKVENKKLQAKTLIESDKSGGQSSVSDTVGDALSRAKQTGAKKDVGDALSAIFDKYKMR